MNPILEAAAEVDAFCRARGWRFCVIGALAVQRWGEPRLTQDVDLAVITGFGGEEAYVDALLGQYAGRRPDAREFALLYRVVLLQTATGVPVDVALGAMPFEERAVARASPFTLPGGETITTCSAEDLVVFKVFAGRDKDWLDVEGVVLRQGDRLDAGLIWSELTPLLELKQDRTTAARLQALLDRR